MQIKNVCVCGAGTMGRGIAQVTAAAGYPTILYELNNIVLQQAQESLHEDLKKLVAKGKMPDEKRQALLKSVVFTSDFQECNAAIIIEAIIEKAEVKIDLFQQLEAF